MHASGGGLPIIQVFKSLEGLKILKVRHSLDCGSSLTRRTVSSTSLRRELCSTCPNGSCLMCTATERSTSGMSTYPLVSRVVTAPEPVRQGQAENGAFPRTSEKKKIGTGPRRGFHHAPTARTRIHPPVFQGGGILHSNPKPYGKHGRHLNLVLGSEPKGVSSKGVFRIRCQEVAFRCNDRKFVLILLSSLPRDIQQ